MPMERKQFPSVETMATVFVSLAAAPVATGLFVNWLYDKLKSSRGVTRIRINREEIEVTADGIKRKIESIHEETH
jgi:hypothetical protein